MLKPPYKVPSMAEIAQIPWNGLRVVSTFSGCGGSCLGYRLAGYRILWANEFIPAAQATYRANHPETFLDTRDIRQVQPQEMLDQCGLAVGDLDLFDGSPPCASFSTAGKRARAWGQVKAYSDTRQRVDDLFFEYARLLEGLQPKVFVAENVSGLIKGVAKGYFKEILARLKGCGYLVEARLLDAQWLGVPQMRQRLFFVGVRQDLRRAPAFPSPLPYRYSVREALPWISALSFDNKGSFPNSRQEFDVTTEPIRTIVVGDSDSFQVMATMPSMIEARLFVEEANGLNSTGLGHHRMRDIIDNVMPTIQAQRPIAFQIEPETDIARYAIGQLWEEIAPGEQHPRRFSLVKPALDKPCNTIDAAWRGDFSPTAISSRASVVHPLEKRKFSIAELKRICAFPDDFVLTGSYAQQWERLGRAVPPVMMQHLARAIRGQILLPVREGVAV